MLFLPGVVETSPVLLGTQSVLPMLVLSGSLFSSSFVVNGRVMPKP